MRDEGSEVGNAQDAGGVGKTSTPLRAPGALMGVDGDTEEARGAVDDRYRAPIVIGVLVFGFYAICWNRGFVSEDHVILRLFAEAQNRGTSLDMLLEQFRGPWLGFEIVSFYRPLTSALLQLQWHLFGATSSGYLIFNLVWHSFNSWCIWWLARDLSTRRYTPQAAAGEKNSEGRAISNRVLAGCTLLFALYPLHPNTVVFVASFGTLACTTFVLLTLISWRLERRVLSSLSFVAALLCYEQAAILPAVLLSLDLLVPVPRRNAVIESGQHSLTRRALAHLPVWFLLAGYFVLRRAVMGDAVGGYESFRQQLFATPVAAATNLIANLGHMLLPVYRPFLPAGLLGGVLLVSAVCAAVYGLKRRRDAQRSRVFAFAISGALLSLLPFLSAGVVPGNGRYFYLGTAFLALAAAACASAALGSRRVLLAAGCRAVLLLLLLSSAGGLFGVLRTYARAGETVDEVRRAVLSATTRSPAMHFVQDVPTFLFEHALPVAHVLHWGLADVVMPPFTEEERVVYPLPGLEVDALAPLLSLQKAELWRYDAAVRSLSSLATEATEQRALVGASEQRQLLLVNDVRPDDPARYLDLSHVQPGLTYELIFLTRGVAHRQRLAGNENHAAGPVASIRFALPEPLIATMQKVYEHESGAAEPAPMFAWVTERDEQGVRRTSNLLVVR